MFEALGSLFAFVLVFGGIILVIVKAASGSRRPPVGRPGMGAPPYYPGQVPPVGQQFPQQGMYPPQPGYQQYPGNPHPAQQGYPQQPGYAPQGMPPQR
ncbi:hypothetical protein [Nocardia caishijiensis]|uniref:Uncharacterized protein n=1 Tax=Nocardia caishijiensis TaxID=184756 RepID=A0ABQ6YK14_9NOCA|nr:hypothetical protein [Nocardia caishijiensis]KAF0845776.1 hypothetical protein FNL39_106165 [Nocardia caishijiensis]